MLNVMDSILKGIINSDHPEALKKQLIEKCIIQAASNHSAANECPLVLAAACDLAFNGESAFSANIALQVYDVWAKNHEECILPFFTPPFLINLLTNNSIKNKAGLFHIVATSLRILQTKEIFPQLCRIIQTRSISFLQENGDLPVLTAVVSFLHEFHQCLPVGEFSATFCAVLVRCLASVSPPTTAAELPCFLGVVASVCNLLQVLWTSNESCVQKTLETIYTVLSSADVGCSPAIAPVVDKLPLHLVDSVTKILMQKKSSSDSSLTIAVARMLDWLTWPGTSNIDNWLVAILKGLADAKMYTLLVNVFEAKIEQVFSFLFYPPTRESVLPVISCMLLSYQHSPLLFHNIAVYVPELIEHLKNEHSEHSKEILRKLSDLLHTLMYLHTGFPELYDPVMEALKGMDPPPVDKMQQLLTVHRWGNQKKYTNETFGYLGTVRSETGLTGLANLGNTCYMNSILQALYITEGLRWKVLKYVSSPAEVLLAKLQEVFAYLMLTQRPAYAPQDFLQMSRPPWFEDGEQQDCSEFLRFLLDKIDDEQKVSRKYVKSRNKECLNSSHSLEEDECDDSVDNSSSLKETQGIQTEQLLHEVFGGTMQTSYKCLNCNKSSVHQDNFTDIHLAFPQSHLKGGQESSVCSDPSTSQDETKIDYLNEEKCQENNLSLEDLISNYFCPETLDGDNKYFCETCKSLQAAKRLVFMLKPPEHLILTLLRFSYSAATNSRVKVITEVSYPLIFRLPYYDSNEKSTDKLNEAIYCLYAVIVHSGSSAECGHYYTYARSSAYHPSCSSGKSCKGELDVLSEKWYLFNDSRVSFSSFDFFQNLTHRFPKDTAYMLFYRRIPSPNGHQDETFQHTVINKELRDTVAKDNTKYLQEQELESQTQQERKKRLWIGSNSHHHDFDDPPTGGCGSSMGGGGIFSSATRFIF